MTDEAQAKILKSAAFKEKTVANLVKSHMKNDKGTLKKKPLILYAELMELFVKEGLLRAANQAKTEGDSVVSIDHFEKILTQLLLDM